MNQTGFRHAIGVGQQRYTWTPLLVAEMITAWRSGLVVVSFWSCAFLLSMTLSLSDVMEGNEEDCSLRTLYGRWFVYP